MFPVAYAVQIIRHLVPPNQVCGLVAARINVRPGCATILAADLTQLII